MNRRPPSAGAILPSITRPFPRDGLEAISDRRAGFTLIEVLAALVVTSAFVVSLTLTAFRI